MLRKNAEPQRIPGLRLPSHWDSADLSVRCENASLNKAHISFSVVRSRNDAPEVIELVKPTHQTRMYGGSVMNWSVVHPEPGFSPRAQESAGPGRVMNCIANAIQGAPDLLAMIPRLHILKAKLPALKPRRFATATASRLLTAAAAAIVPCRVSAGGVERGCRRR
jgi:hypothetical protein